jgi:class 3 adenylate cyclase
VSAAAEAASSGVVTILITDVEGSTRRWEDDADEMRLKLPNTNGHAGGPA